MNKVKGVNLSQEAVESMLVMPNGFTGRWRDGNYYYLGRQWFGPTNKVGAKRVLGFKVFLTNPLTQG